MKEDKEEENKMSGETKRQTIKGNKRRIQQMK